MNNSQKSDIQVLVEAMCKTKDWRWKLEIWDALWVHIQNRKNQEDV